MRELIEKLADASGLKKSERDVLDLFQYPGQKVSVYMVVEKKNPKSSKIYSSGARMFNAAISLEKKNLVKIEKRYDERTHLGTAKYLILTRV